MAFDTYCQISQDGDFEDKFNHTVIQISAAPQLIKFLLGELQKTRFHFNSLEIDFHTVASINQVNMKNIPIFWAAIKDEIINFTNIEPDYDRIKQKLNTLTKDQKQITSTMKSIEQLITRSKKTLAAHIDLMKTSFPKRLGVLGELISYLYVKDIQNSECIYHKLIPDNPIMPRHGMDLLSIKFGSTSDEDLIFFWEAKSTIEHFSDRCKEIIDWFNQESEVPITMAIEGARLDWSKKFTPQKFKRASSVLSKFLYQKSNYSFNGSIVIDSNNTPSSDKIRKFNDIKVDRNEKRLTTFNTEKLKDIVNGVFSQI